MTEKAKGLLRPNDMDFENMTDEQNRSLCRGCTICCEHVTLEIDKPESKEDFSDIVWYVLHEGVSVFIDDDDDWYFAVKTKCKSLDGAGNCRIHKDRPKVCRNYAQDECERYGEGKFYKHMFNTREHVLDYVKNYTKIKDLDGI